MKRSIAFVFAGALALAAFAPSSAESQSGGRPPHVLGPLHIGMSFNEVQALGFPLHHNIRVLNEHQVITEHVTVMPGQVIDALIQDNQVIDLSTASADYVIPGGGHVGMTLAEVRALYPSGHLYWGSNSELGPFMNYDTGASGVSFAFNTDNLRPECMETHRRCPTNFDNKRVMMVVVR